MEWLGVAVIFALLAIAVVDIAVCAASSRISRNESEEAQRE